MKPFSAGRWLLFIIFSLTMINCKSLPTAVADNSGVLYPRALRQGDRVGIVSPAGPIDGEIIDSAAAVLRTLGYEPVVYPHAKGRNGYLSGTADERFADLQAALADTTVRAILCSRGGYGVVHNLDRLGRLDLRKDPKWVIGFSDISALHALMASQGVASIHASMAKPLAAYGPDNADNAALLAILRGEAPSYTFAATPYNRQGEVTGQLLGGNVAVLQALMSTPFNIIKPGTILFIEDVSEPVYKIERILYQLRLSGVLHNLKGLIVGQFTDYKPDAQHGTMEEMIAKAVADCDFPIAFGAPVGHVDHNVPLIESATVTLTVGPDSTTVAFSPLAGR